MHEGLSKKVRLKDFEIKAIQNCFAKYFLSTDHIWLFGSRVDLNRRGGDIDLYIETGLSASEAAAKKIAFLTDLWDAIGEQKIDIVLHLVAHPEKIQIYAVAIAEGVQLA